MQRRFEQVDVFSDDLLGNPVAVVLDAEGLSDEDMQRFARWTNLSETTFVLPPTDALADYRVRIFTPSEELPFAGHPTLGTAHAWVGESGAPDVIQECAAGLIPLRRVDGQWAFAAPPLVRSGPVAAEDLAAVCGILGVERVVDAQWVDNGPGWVAVLLDSVEALMGLQPGLLRGYDIGAVALHPGGDPVDLEVRAFFDVAGMTVEDPVTGSLNASLAPWLTSTGLLSYPYTARQGTAIGRNGRVRLTQADGEVWVAGATSTCIRGSVAL